MFGKKDGLDFGGVQFFNDKDSLLLEVGNIEQHQREIVLKDYERLIGIKANRFAKSTYMYDLQFVIGWLE